VKILQVGTHLPAFSSFFRFDQKVVGDVVLLLETRKNISVL